MFNKRCASLLLIFAPLLLALCTVCVYYPSLHYPFQFDDLPNIVKYFNIRTSFWKTICFKNARWLSYCLNSFHYRIGNLDPFTYRLFNVLLHTLTGLGIYCYFLLALRSLTKPSFFSRNAFTLALLTAGLFLLHPVQTQTVSYVIQGQLEGLATFFMVALCLCFLLLVRTQALWLRISLYCLFYALALVACGTKEIAIISPLLVILTDWFFVAQGSWQNFKKRLLIHASLLTGVGIYYVYLLKPSFFMSLFSLSITASPNRGNALTAVNRAPITSWHFALTQSAVIVHYIRIFLWPFSLSADYDYKLIEQFWSFECLIPLLLLLSIALSTYLLMRKQATSLIAFGVCWFMVCVLPRASIIPSPELVADYKTYSASLGILFLLALALTWLFEKACIVARYQSKSASQFVALIASTLLFMPLGITTYFTNTVWRSAKDFWGNVIDHAPLKARGYNNYGIALAEEKNYQSAIGYFMTALSLDKNYAQPYINLALVYNALNDSEKEIYCLRKALTLEHYSIELYNNLALVLIKNDRYAAAEKALKAALLINPHYGKALYHLGALYFKQDKLEQAWHYFKACCTEGDFDTELGFVSYGFTSYKLNKLDEAIFAYQKALACNPQSAEALQGLSALRSHVHA